MAAPNYRNAEKPTAPKPQTTAVPWVHGMDEVHAAAGFNAKCDKMAADGYSYQGSIQVSQGAVLLIFTRQV